jgi:hypothetical protein
MTAEQWKQAEEKYGLYTPIKIMIDGYEVSLHMALQTSKSKIVHSVYVNGWSKGIWWDEKDGHPESQFMYHKKSTINRCKKTKAKELLKLFGKKKYEEIFAPKTISVLTPFYPSFAAFKRQMIALNKEITLVNE